MNGPEDSPGWKKLLEETNSPAVETCHWCEKLIKFWHCANMGCPWCAQCGTNAKDIREKRKNGTD